MGSGLGISSRYRVVLDRGQGSWEEFLTETAPRILQIVRLFEHDPDLVEDCFVFVCEKLKQNDARRLKRFDDGGKARFQTWLRVVVRNLHLDWRRQRFGRPRPFRTINGLSEPDQEVYRVVYLHSLTESEALEAVRLSFPGFTRANLVSSLERIAGKLSSRQWWLLASRRLHTVPISRSGTRGDDFDLDVADSRPNPEEKAILDEQLRMLRKGLAELTQADRLLLRLRYEQALTLEEIARVAGIGSVSTVRRKIERALRDLRFLPGEAQKASVSVKLEMGEEAG